MITIGRGIRWYNSYIDEVNFCKEHNFDFLQIWFKEGEILINDIPCPKEKYLKDIGFPVIIHAVFENDDFVKYGDALLDIVEYLEIIEVIIHPICEKSTVNESTQKDLVKQVKMFSHKAMNRGIMWYLENNSVIDIFHYQKEDLKMVYDSDNYVEQLLDVAHIDNYEHLQYIIEVKYPKCLHVAGKRFAVEHEHLSLEYGDIDYNLVFRKYLKGFDGRIILEGGESDAELIESKKIIDKAVLECDVCKKAIN